MASKYQYRNRYYIGYTLNGKRKVKDTGLEYIPSNERKAETIRKKIEEVESKNKLKIKLGMITTEKNEKSLRLSDVFEEYDATMNKQSGQKDHHRQSLKVAMSQFFKVIDRKKMIGDVSEKDIRLFVAEASLNANTTSIRTYLRYLKLLFNYALDKKYISDSPISRRVIPKDEEKVITIFERNDIKEILSKARQRNPEYFKIYKMLLLTGIRPNDLLALKASDFNLVEGFLRLTISKTRRVIEYPIHGELTKFLSKEFPNLKSMGEELLFKKYSVERIGKTFRKICKELDFGNKGYNLKTFRKTFASILAERGLPEGDLADLLGHTSVQTTRQFYKKKNAAAIRKRINKTGGLKIC